MKKSYCIKCNGYRKFEEPKIRWIFDKTAFCVICDKCESKEEKIFKEEHLIEVLIILTLFHDMKEYQTII